MPAMLVEGFPLWIFETNCWIAAPGEDGPCIVVDAPRDPDAIEARLAAHRLEPVALLITHGHVDHVGGAGLLVERYAERYPERQAMPVYVHDLDRRDLLDPRPQVAAFVPDAAAMAFPEPPKVETVDDGDVLELAGLRLRAIHTPGHTPGSTCFLMHDPRGGDADVLFSGDHLMAGTVGRTDMPGGSFDDLMISLKKIVDLDPETFVATGHGASTTIGREAAANPFLVEARYA